MSGVLPALTRDDLVQWFVGTPVTIVLVVIGAVIVRWLLIRVINRTVAATTSKSAARLAERGRAGRVLARAMWLSHERHVQRTTTMGALLRSVTTFVIASITILTVLDLLDVPLAPLLTSAGIGGVALGFGAQSLVKDFLSGIFMILEDQYGVGDVIDTGEVIGTVENVELRVTTLRDAAGMVWYVRNGEIVRVGNKSQGWATAIVDIPVAWEENIEKVIGLIRDVVAQFDDDPVWRERLLELPDVVGVESMTGSAMTVRILAKCANDAQFAVQREIRERVKTAFDRAGVKGPPTYPFGGPK